MIGWPEALDRYEAALAAHEAILAGDESAGLPVRWPLPGLPTDGVPPEHEERARLLLARSDELARRLTAYRDSLPPLNAARRVSPRSATAAPHRVDRAM